MNELHYEELKELQRLSEEELEGFNIDSLQLLTWSFRKLSSLQEKVNEVKQIADYERSRIDDWEKSQSKNYLDNISFFEHKIFEYHQRELLNDPKQKSIKTPYGTVKSTTKKAYPKKSDEKLLLEFLNKNNPDFVKVETKESVIWDEFKKTLNVVETPGGKIAVDEYGMIIEGVTIQEENTTFKVELK